MKPAQSLRLLAGLLLTLRPLLLASFAKLQLAWSTHSLAVAADAQSVERSEQQLTRVYELLSDLQMQLDKRRPSETAAAGTSGSAGQLQSSPTSSQRERRAQPLSEGLYVGDGEEDALRAAPAALPQSPRWSKSDAEASARGCWHSFRLLLSVSVSLLVSHSPLHAHLLHLHYPDGRPMQQSEVGDYPHYPDLRKA